MRHLIKLSWIFLLSFLISSCSLVPQSNTIFQNRDTAYLSATSLPPLRIPPGYTINDYETYYPVSNKVYPKNSQTVALTPPGLS